MSGLPLLAKVFIGIIGGIIGAVCGAVLLRAAVALGNRILGDRQSPTAIEEPSLGPGMLIIITTAAANYFLGLVLNTMLGAPLGRPDEGLSPGELQVLAAPVGVLVTAIMLTAMLSTSFLRALLVTILQFMLVLAIGLPVYLVVKELLL